MTSILFRSIHRLTSTARLRSGSVSGSRSGKVPLGLSRPVTSVPVTTTNETTSSPPPLSHILETCIYVRDLRASSRFYADVLAIRPFLDTPRIAGFSLASTTLLLFELGRTGDDTAVPGGRGVIPGHGPTEGVMSQLSPFLSQLASGEGEAEGKGEGGSNGNRKESLKQHFCFAVSRSQDVGAWESYLGGKGVKITSSVTWERGGRSIYFEDLDGHVVEIASRGLWPHY